MRRRATCSCGALSVVAQGEPEKVSACHCLECQRRTGSAFGIALFFANEAVETFGSTTSFSRLGASGRPIEFHFCPSCGSTVFWKPAFRPGMTAVAFGCFEVKDGLKPTQSVYEEHRHPWVGIETT
ncbi:GFA family protein [Shinella sp. M31]|uniref:GFA family protein n=1 Tax=Shinella sp. M31 TaxID=3368615 RepID=UPI003BA1E73F